jgi:phosphoglycolate phosphatase-like HAD superfamily hydrolase
MTDKPAFTASELPSYPWLEVLNPSVSLGRVRHALFDFDGTISVIRRGWETIMIPMMVEMICDGHPSPAGLEDEVASYVDRSTGVLTIEQMRWLAEAVRRYGLAQHPRSAREYKKIYNERLLNPVRLRIAQMDHSGEQAADTLMIVGARAFLQGLHDRGVTMYLASGTDHGYVMEEAVALGVTAFFGQHIYGAQDDTEASSKERIIQRIMSDHNLHGEELLVVGDGPVEIRHAKSSEAIALGVAANEEQRQGLAPRQRQRLLAAGADFIVTDFSHHEELLAMFTDQQAL